MRHYLIWFTAISLAATLAHAQSNLADQAIANLHSKPNDLELLAQVKAAIPNVTNSNDKCRLGVIYVLGCLASGNTAEGLVMREKVLKAFPGHALTAELDEKQILQRCKSCISGQVQVPCKTCQGKGTCVKCDGTKQQQVQGFDGPRTVKCMVCSGLGTCKTCNGARMQNEPCAECRGTGRVPVPHLIQAAYLRMLGAIPDAPKSAISTNMSPDDAEVERAIRAATAQAARSPLLSRYPLIPKDAENLRSTTLTTIERNELGKIISQRALRTDSYTGFFYVPIPAGLSYRVCDVSRAGKQIHLFLSSEPTGDPAIDSQLTKRTVIARIEQALCPAFKGFLQTPEVVMPEYGMDDGEFKKNDIVKSGSWFIPARIYSINWSLSLGANCYRSEPEYYEINQLTGP